jgi:hypothetical protein
MTDEQIKAYIAEIRRSRAQDRSYGRVMRKGVLGWRDYGRTLKNGKGVTYNYIHRNDLAPDLSLYYMGAMLRMAYSPVFWPPEETKLPKAKGKTVTFRRYGKL